MGAQQEQSANSLEKQPVPRTRSLAAAGLLPRKYFGTAWASFAIFPREAAAQFLPGTACRQEAWGRRVSGSHVIKHLLRAL